MTITFSINKEAEAEAGIQGYSDEISLNIESGEILGEKEEFLEYMRQSIKEWYDGASVNITNINEES